MSELRVEATDIPGLLLVHMPVHGDSRGWFKENWQREKMVARGLPDFRPIQNNISFNEAAGTTRGIHAEPWDKYISVATGRIFGAWVDLREGPSFGRVVTSELGPETAVFVPRGVGNSFQTLTPNAAYTYLVTDHWSQAASYTNLNLADETVAIDWPIPLKEAEISAKDRAHPRLAEVAPVSPKPVLIIGAAGQLGRALAAEYGERAELVMRGDLDFSRALESQRDWRSYSAVFNAAAYTAVDQAETPSGRVQAWETNAQATAALAEVCAQNGLTLVHFSSDYVFDGRQRSPYTEAAPLCPLGVYGQTKAAGDIAALTNPLTYVLRTSWVIGDGNNFVRTMARLAGSGVDPRVIDDQIGRLTFTKDLARAARHLTESGSAHGLYNVTGSGEPGSWADIAKAVYRATGHDPDRVTPVTTAEYYQGQDPEKPVAPRPHYSVLDLGKITDTGFAPADQWGSLGDYLAREELR